MSRLIVLVGIPGSGKSTYAKKLLEQNPDAIYLASDLIRKELYGSEAIVGDKNKVFRILHLRTKEALNQNKTVIFDATNLTRKARRNAFNDAKESVIKEIHVIWAPIHVCIERDKKRSRTVGRKDIMRLATGFQAPWWDEGVHLIKIVSTYPHDAEEYINCCMNAMQIPHDNPHHTLDILEHCRAAYEHAIRSDYPKSVINAALFHDIGKPLTKTFSKSSNDDMVVAHYYQHDNIGGWMSYGLTNDPNQAIELSWLISNHMQPYFDSKYYKNMQPHYKALIDMLHDCDVSAH